MAAKAPTQIVINNITTIAQVADALEILNVQLPVRNLTQYLLFNRSYQIVTRLIQQDIKDNRFDNPKFIESFIVTFAAFYFTAINAVSNDSPDLSAPWAKLNEYAKNKSAPVFISLMLGANAHINNDLPQVLVTMMKNEKPEELLGDISKLDKILMKSGKQIIGIFEEKNPILNFLKDRLQFTYYRPAMYTILYWRIRAWNSYEKIKKDESAMLTVSKRSVRIANRILYLSKAISMFDSSKATNTPH